MNMAPSWMHVMKRNVSPGEKIPLNDLYKQYGEKYDLVEDDDFIEWLKNVKLKNTRIWKIVYGDDLDTTVESKPTVIDADNTPIKAVNKMTIKEVVGLSVRKGREVLPKITDLKLLKYAFQEANQLAGKDSLCNVIRRRIKDLELGR